MKPLPRDPFAFHARVFGAFCDDLFDIAAGRSKSCDRTSALREISREARAAEEAAGNNRGD